MPPRQASRHDIPRRRRDASAFANLAVRRRKGGGDRPILPPDPTCRRRRAPRTADKAAGSGSSLSSASAPVSSGEACCSAWPCRRPSGLPDAAPCRRSPCRAMAVRPAEPAAPLRAPFVLARRVRSLPALAQLWRLRAWLPPRACGPAPCARRVCAPISWPASWRFCALRFFAPSSCGQSPAWRRSFWRRSCAPSSAPFCARCARFYAPSCGWRGRSSARSCADWPSYVLCVSSHSFSLPWLSAPICSDAASTAQTGAYRHESRFTDPGLPSHPASHLFFSLYDDRRRKWQFGALRPQEIERPPRARTAMIRVETAWFQALAIEDWRSVIRRQAPAEWARSPSGGGSPGRRNEP